MLDHGGNIYEIASKYNIDPKSIHDFSSNINPLGFPNFVRPLINSHIPEILSYPDFRYEELRELTSRFYNKKKEHIVFGNGALELFSYLPRILKPERALILSPTFSEYQKQCELYNIKVLNLTSITEIKENLLPNTIVFLCHPNNPTGRELPFEETKDLIENNPENTFIIDESFIDFTDFESFSKLKNQNLIIIKSLTKLLGIPGLRIGLALFNSDLSKTFSKHLPCWNLNVFSEAIAIEFYKDPKDFLLNTKNKTKELLTIYKEELSKYSDIEVLSSKANFILCKLQKTKSNEIKDYLLKNHKVLVRDCSNFNNLDDSYIRVALKEDYEPLFEGLSSFYKKKSVKKKEVPAIMFQGTGSDVGKSLINAGICRILTQEGYKVAPFKAQNMSLNSYVASDGEMGIAQALQAKAARLEPTVLMNPLLLKPSSKTMSQIIFRGKVFKNDTFNKRDELFSDILDDYHELSQNKDIMVLEGAGSPAEVNLKEFDIVNMKMAKAAKAQVYLIGDIDRGGVIASFMGTFDTLYEWERKLIKGLIVNKFRGDKTLFKDGPLYLEKYLKVPVLGTIDYLNNLNLPDEDSVAFKKNNISTTNELTIGVLDTPYISILSDIDPFKGEPDVSLRIIRKKEDFKYIDALLLLGSKSVVNDLEFLKPYYEEIKKQKTIFGLCGGLQILGEEILDPDAVESSTKSAKGLGLLNIKTTMYSDKTLSQKESSYFDHKVKGFEIHHGKTIITHESTNSLDQDLTGFISKDQNIMGSYLHGVFDNDLFRRFFIDKIRVSKNLAPLKEIQYVYDVDSSLDILANHLRNCLDIEKITKQLGL